jgi:hypothetical protein
MPISTESQRQALGLVKGSLFEASAALFEFIKQSDAGSHSDAVDVAKLRLDALVKIQREILDPLIEDYVRLEGPDLPGPGTLLAGLEERNARFLTGMLQGLNQNT